MKIKSIERLTHQRLISSYGMEPNPAGMKVYVHAEVVDAMQDPVPHRLDHYMIVLILAGSFVIRINDIEQVFEKNELILISPNTIRQLISAEKGTKGISVSFTDDFLTVQGNYKNILYPFDTSDPAPPWHFPLAEKDASLLTDILRLLHRKNTRGGSNPFDKEVLYHDFSSLMLEITSLARNAVSGIRPNVSRKDDIFARFHKLLATHFKEQRSLKFYAGRLFITPNYLTKIVKEMVGKTAGDLIDAMVTLEAKVLLRDASISISEIADQLYFGDAFIFSKFFKRQTGSSPSVFRKTAFSTAV